MKPTTALIIGAGALAIVFIWSRSKSSTLTTAPKTTASTGASLLGSLLGGAASGFFASPGASSGTSTNTSSTTGSQNSVDYTQASNYIADTTAASDSASGVVGFGGWPDV